MTWYILAGVAAAVAVFVFGYVTCAILSSGTDYDRLHELYGIDPDDEEIIR